MGNTGIAESEREEVGLLRSLHDILPDDPVLGPVQEEIGVPRQVPPVQAIRVTRGHAKCDGRVFVLGSIHIFFHCSNLPKPSKSQKSNLINHPKLK
jgi:hypothetical protein